MVVFSMKKISHKIALAIIASVGIVSLFIGAISVIQSRGIIESNTMRNLLAISSQLAEQIDGETHSIEIKVADLAATIAYDVDMEKMQNDAEYPTAYSHQIVPLVTQYAESGQINVDCYVNFLNKYSRDGFLIGPNVINQDGTSFKRVDFGTKIADMESDKPSYDWYYAPISLKTGYWTAPYFDPITQYYMVSYVEPILVQDEVVGIAGMDVKFSKLQEIVNDAKVYNTGYASLIDSQYNFLVHPDFGSTDNLRTVNNHELENFAAYIDQHESGVYETAYFDKDKFIGFSKLGNGYVLLVSVNASEVLQEEKELTYAIVVISILGSILAALFGVYISSLISTPIQKLKVYAEEITKGNYNTDIVLYSNDEIGQFAETFSLMTKNLISANQELSDVYQELSEAEVELRAQYETLSENEAQLRNSEERYRLAVDGSNDVIWEIDLLTHAFYASAKFYELTGYPLNSIQTSDMLEDYIHPDDLLRVRQELANYYKHKAAIYQSEYRLKKASGGYLWVFSRGKALWEQNGFARKISGSISDYTDKKITEDRIKFMAYYDSLTLLPNRAYFIEIAEEKIQAARAQHKEGAIFFIDLDNFKNINDTLGHGFGDQVLVCLAKKLSSVLCEQDMVFRLGGDEFVLLHPYDDPLEVAQYADQILAVIHDITEVLQKSINLSSSIGIAIYPKDGFDIDSILKNADVAMYKAKQLGKNRYELYDEKMYHQITRKTSIERILRDSIKNQELSVFYQPQYKASTGKVFGFEALMRLNSKELGPISPAEFIPIAEESGYITAIDRWIFREVCMKTAQWIQAGYPIHSMSINISSLDMLHPAFLENIKCVLHESALEPNIIELEITETVLMESIDSKIGILKELMDIGVRIALDDFGTGYSSLNYLRIIPISTLKIDKSFVDNMSISKKEAAIINNIIQMAHGLELKVIAEGVEDAQQYHLLSEKGCDYIQGYYFSKPLPEAAVEALLQAETAQ